jgi:kynureninase
MQQRLGQPIAGWFGHADQFAFAPGFVPAPDIRRFQVGTPPILSMVAAGEGIAVTAEAGMDAIRAKSTALTGSFIAAVRGLDVASPLIAEHRGSHVTIRHRNAGQITQAMRSRDVIVDFRAPDLVRFGFAPLYSTFDEAWRAAQILLDVIGTEAYRRFPESRGSAT